MKRIIVTKNVLFLFGIMLGIECLGLSILTPFRIKIADIEKALHIYTIDHDGKFPNSLDELLLFASHNYDYGKKPLLTKEDLLDPWANPLNMNEMEKSTSLGRLGLTGKWGLLMIFLRVMSKHIGEAGNQNQLRLLMDRKQTRFSKRLEQSSPSSKEEPLRHR